jgi:hypothetical protein
MIRYSYAETDQTDTNKHHSIAPEISRGDDEQTYFATAPQLSELRISTFNSDLFSPNSDDNDDKDATMPDNASSRRSSRRQATCFGLGLGTFQYSLPEDETTSKSTITAPTEPTIRCTQRESSVTQLMADFAFLGEAVN